MANLICTHLIYALFFTTKIYCDILTYYISYYEPLTDPSIPFFNEKQQSTLTINAFGQDFQLIITPGNRVFDSSTKLTIYGGNKSKIVSSSDINRHLVRGHVKGIQDSSVSGCVLNGLFSGVINLPDETYYIESATDYFNKSNLYFKSVIYRQSDVNFTALLCKDDGKSCQPFHDPMTSSAAVGIEYLNGQSIPFYEQKKKGNKDKRNVGTTQSTDKICTLRVIVDHVYYQKVSGHTFESVITKLVMIFDGVDRIFRRADFNFDGMPDGIGFKISEIVFWWNSNQPDYPLSDESLNSVDYLKLLAMDDISSECLGFAITARDFGISVGLAASRQVDAGICAEKPIGGIRMNVAVATLFLRGQQLPNSIAEIVIAHEIGHSFGSGHDPITVGPCAPSEEDGGPYLMSSVLSSPRLPNNHIFSTCSLENITNMMKIFGSSCFVPENVNNSCGNGFVDSSTEVCDCGLPNQCDNIDSCCTPQGGLYSDTECNYRNASGAECSFRQDACCTTKCRIVSFDDHRQCNDQQECNKPSYCDGTSKDCPSSDNKPDGTQCREGLGICRNGVCEEIICKAAGMVECVCSELKDDCQLCCRYRGLCIQASILGITMDGGVAYNKPDGEPCINGRGVCISRRCQKVGKTSWVDDVKTSMSTSENQKLYAIVILVTILSVGLCFLILLGFCVFNVFTPSFKRHVVRNWSQLRRPRTEVAITLQPQRVLSIQSVRRKGNVYDPSDTGPRKYWKVFPRVNRQQAARKESKLSDQKKLYA